MKKLILVTLLAVGASWLLSEVQDSRPLLPPPPAPSPTQPVAPARSVVVSAKTPKKSKDARKVARPVAYQPAPAPAASRTIPVWFPKTEVEEEAKAQPDASGIRVLVGRVSASEERAREDLRKTVEREVAEWVAADVPTTWKIPGRFLDAMARESYVQEVTRSLKTLAADSPGPAGPLPESASASAAAAAPKAEIPGLDDLYTLYRAGQRLDFSDRTRARIVQAYRQDLASGRMKRVGGGLALALVCLAVVSGYIKADEATRGYYTNRLRLLAAAGLGAAGVAAYRYWA